MTRLSAVPSSMIFWTTGSTAGRASVFWGLAATDSSRARAVTSKRARFFMDSPPGRAFKGGMIVSPPRGCQGAAVRLEPDPDHKQQGPGLHEHGLRSLVDIDEAKIVADVEDEDYLFQRIF